MHFSNVGAGVRAWSCWCGATHRVWECAVGRHVQIKKKRNNLTVVTVLRRALANILSWWRRDEGFGLSVVDPCTRCCKFQAVAGKRISELS